MRVRSWQANVFEMLTCIPTVNLKSMNNYFRSIESKLSFYESLKDSPALLELAIWGSKITEQCDHNNDHLIRKQCCTDSLTMVMIIIPTVFSFLTGGSGCNKVVGDNDDDDGDGDDYNDTDDDSDDSVMMVN